ncbi:McrB family protein [Flavobacterium lacus]|uniref:Dynein-related subfamily AAA family protein n=1 Tax=Flavobacterium lacus TaxID=1353778 RepID=A0A328WXD2_9FLAO|nr:AAA family ATPase [Flavobacterium lacus]RAR50872.1 dynein-related subfamily AAA family protein [Flavobacterium lacus]
MNYWHIQLHPDNRLSIVDLISILNTKKVIGLGEEWNDRNNNPVLDPQYFKKDMRIGDVVMVRDTVTPVALVKIESDAFIEKNIDEDFDWFKLRRKVSVLNFFEDSDKNTLDEILKKYGNKHIQAPGTLTFCQGDNATNKFIKVWHKKSIYKNIMESLKLSQERQDQIKLLWTKFKSDTKKGEEKYRTDEIAKLLNDWDIYRVKIINDTLTLEDFTNILNNPTATMPGGYLCNFLERTTKTVFGSSKPGNAENFEVKLNNDNDTYFIKSEKNHKATKVEAETYFNTNIKVLLKKIIEEKDPLKKIEIIDTANYSAKQILMKVAVLEHVSSFLSIYSTDVLNSLYEEFIEGDATGNLDKSHQIMTVSKKLLEIQEDNKYELTLLAWFLWQYSTANAIADKDNPNVIMYGPPGTGKTYAVINSLDFVCQGDSSRFEILQFHPSFTYEDFIEGIKPKGVSKDGNIRFELVNGVFKNFCIKAKKNPNKEYYFVVDEINRANLSSVFGETLSLLERDYRHDVSIADNTKNIIRTQYSSLIDELISENPLKKDLAYAIDNNVVKFGVPSNVFFIGMMNDVDKSIDAFDLALRRRFKWIRKDCDYDVVEEETKFKNKEDFNNIVYYKKACERLNNYISYDLGLGKSYEFGHSFFMKMKDIAKRKEITQNNMEVLFNLYLRPTLKEYLRAVFAESELDNKLNDALANFKAAIN